MSQIVRAFDVDYGNTKYVVGHGDKGITIVSPFFAKPFGTSQLSNRCKLWRQVDLRRPAFVLRPQ